MHSATLSKTTKCIVILVKVVLLEILEVFRAADLPLKAWNANKKAFVTGIHKSSWKFPGTNMSLKNCFQSSALGTLKIAKRFLPFQIANKRLWSNKFMHTVLLSFEQYLYLSLTFGTPRRFRQRIFWVILVISLVGHKTLRKI